MPAFRKTDANNGTGLANEVVSTCSPCFGGAAAAMPLHTTRRNGQAFHLSRRCWQGMVAWWSPHRTRGTGDGRLPRQPLLDLEMVWVGLPEPTCPTASETSDDVKPKGCVESCSMAGTLGLWSAAQWSNRLRPRLHGRLPPPGRRLQPVAPPWYSHGPTGCWGERLLYPPPSQARKKTKPAVCSTAGFEGFFWGG